MYWCDYLLSFLAYPYSFDCCPFESVTHTHTYIGLFNNAYYCVYQFWTCFTLLWLIAILKRLHWERQCKPQILFFDWLVKSYWLAIATRCSSCCCCCYCCLLIGQLTQTITHSHRHTHTQGLIASRAHKLHFNVYYVLLLEFQLS